MNTSVDFYNLLSARNKLKEAIELMDKELLAQLPDWKQKAYHGFRYEAMRQLSIERSIPLVETKRIISDFEDWVVKSEYE